MANKTETALAFVNAVAAKASNRTPGNALSAALVGNNSPGKRLSARLELSQDPDMSLLDVEYATIATAVATCNAASIVTIPSLAEVRAAIEAAPSGVPV